MKLSFLKISSIIILILASITYFTLDSSAYRGRGNGRNIDTSSVETIKGSISKIERFGRNGYGFRVKSDNKSILVMIGPYWYLEEKGIKFSVNDNVEVTGFKGTCWGEDSVVAKEITVSGKTHQFRDNDGYPVWRGQGRGRGNGKGRRGRGGRGYGGCW